MIEAIKNQMKKQYGFYIEDVFSDMFEFSGIVKNHDGDPFRVDGDIELTEDNQLAYSVVFYDMKRKKEYDAMSGYCTVNENVDYILSMIVEPNFEMCS